jgi:hypothetical protein
MRPVSQKWKPGRAKEIDGQVSKQIYKSQGWERVRAAVP